MRTVVSHFCKAQISLWKNETLRTLSVCVTGGLQRDQLPQQNAGTRASANNNYFIDTTIAIAATTMTTTTTMCGLHMKVFHAPHFLRSSFWGSRPTLLYPRPIYWSAALNHDHSYY